MTKQQRAAIDAVARRFSATWLERNAGAELIVAGKRVALEIRTLEKVGAGQDVARPRLRFDKVVTRLMERLQAALGKAVPDGTTVLLTVTAPIRLASKTAASLDEQVHTLLDRGSPTRDWRATIHGNRIQVRIVTHESVRAPRLIGFVHNSDTDPLLLLNMTDEWLDLCAEAGSRASRLAGERWLVVTSARHVSCLDAYRHIHSLIPMKTDFEKVLMVFGDGRVGMLTGESR